MHHAPPACHGPVAKLVITVAPQNRGSPKPFCRRMHTYMRLAQPGVVSNASMQSIHACYEAGRYEATLAGCMEQQRERVQVRQYMASPVAWRCQCKRHQPTSNFVSSFPRFRMSRDVMVRTRRTWVAVGTAGACCRLACCERPSNCWAGATDTPALLVASMCDRVRPAATAERWCTMVEWLLSCCRTESRPMSAPGTPLGELC